MSRLLSNCCDAVTINGRCQDCKENSGTYIEYDCELCQDTGEVTTMEQVYPNEPHMAPIGTEKCMCKMVEDDWEPND